MPLLSIKEHFVPLPLLQQWMNDTQTQMKRIEVMQFHQIAASCQCPNTSDLADIFEAASHCMHRMTGLCVLSSCQQTCLPCSHMCETTMIYLWTAVNINTFVLPYASNDQCTTYCHLYALVSALII